MSLTMTLLPRVSEKTYDHSEKLGVYVFIVPNKATTSSIKSAVQNQFKVSVTKVNVLNQDGKAKRTYRKNGRSVIGKRTDFKKAYVTLKKGEIIPIFGTADEVKNEQKAKKEAK